MELSFSSENKRSTIFFGKMIRPPNTKGVESLGLQPLDSGVISAFDTVIYLGVDELNPPHVSAKNIILWGVGDAEVKAIKMSGP